MSPTMSCRSSSLETILTMTSTSPGYRSNLPSSFGEMCDHVMYSKLAQVDGSECRVFVWSAWCKSVEGLVKALRVDAAVTTRTNSKPQRRTSLDRGIAACRVGLRRFVNKPMGTKVSMGNDHGQAYGQPTDRQ